MPEPQCITAHARLISGRCPWCGRIVVYGQALPRGWAADSRKLRFEFHGGFKDGEVVTGHAASSDLNARQLFRCLYLTDGGRVGTRFDEVPPRSPLTESTIKELEAMKKALEANDTKAFRELLNKRRSGDAGQHTYEVTQREDRPDEIVVRLDLVDQGDG